MAQDMSQGYAGFDLPSQFPIVIQASDGVLGLGQFFFFCRPCSAHE